MKKLSLSLFALLLAVALPLVLPSAASAAFNQNNIMSDYVYGNAGTMSAGQIDAFLNSFPNSCISTGKGFVSPSLNGYNPGYNPSQGFLYGGNVSAGTVIATAAQAYDLNPQVILATLQKEQSLVSGSAGCHYETPPTQTCTGSDRPYGTYDSCVTACQYAGGCVYIAMGYDCPYYCVPNSTGFSKQIIKAAWKMKFVQQRSLGNYNWNVQKPGWDNSDDPLTSYDGYMTQGVLKRNAASAPVEYDGLRPVNSGALTVHLGSGATASLYSFTPFTSGNTNFVNIFEAWFGSTHAGPSMVLPRNSGNPLVLVSNQDTTLDIIGITNSDSIYRKRQVAPDSTSWGSWVQKSGALRNLSAEASSEGRVQIVGAASNGNIYYSSQDSPNSEIWEPWSQLDGGLIAVTQARNSDGSLEIFGIAGNESIYRRRQAVANSSSWHPWDQISGALKKIAAGQNADGSLQLVGVANNGSIYTNRQTAPNSDAWGGWTKLDGALSNITMARNQDGTIEITGTAGNGNIYTLRQTSPNSTSWSPWTRLDGGLINVESGTNSDGRLQLIGTASNGNVYTRSQTSANSTVWTPWVQLDGALRSQ